MKNLLITGIQWGDEGKGKIVDWFSDRADVVVRFQGGHNAGHTITISEKVYKLSVLPSGILRENILCCIGSGVIVDPWALMKEMAKLRQQTIKISPKNLYIAGNACLVLPIHTRLDVMREQRKGIEKIGTTMRGIGPAYEDKVARRAIRLCDLVDATTIERRVDKLLEHYTPLFRGLGETIDRAQLCGNLQDIATKIFPYGKDVWRHLYQAQNRGKRIIFEGAQGMMLDIDHGTYPFVTSCNTIPGQAAIGSGVPPQRLGYILGVVKAYTTRVGSGPFPTELSDSTGVALQNRGSEWGTVTQRQRRCGWFDAALARQAVRIGGVMALALTKLDVLDGMKEVRLCVGYHIDGKRYEYYPSNLEAQRRAEPIYETLPGWQSKTYGCRTLEQLPKEALLYVKHLEKYIGVPIVMISTSPERDDTIVIRDPLADN